MPGSRRVILRHVFAGLGARMCRSRPHEAASAAGAPNPATAAAAAAARQPVVSMSRLRRRLIAIRLGILGCGHTASAGLLLLLMTGGGSDGGADIGVDSGGVRDGLATLLTLLLAGAAAVLAGLVYAELAARTPATDGVAMAAGPAYAAAHSALGEFLAFLIGWNLLLEHVLGGAALARCIVEQLDGLLDGAVKNVTRHLLPGAAPPSSVAMVPGSTTYATEPAAAGGLAALICVAAAILAVTGATSAGRRASCVASTCLAVCAIIALIAMTAVAFDNADLTNWAPTAIHGLAPTRGLGVLTRAAAIMYVFSGLDTMAATAGGPTTFSHELRATLDALASSAATVATLPSAALASASCAAVGILLSGAALSLMGPPGTPGAALTALTDYMVSPIGAIVGALTVAGVCGALLGTSASTLAVIRALAADGLICRCVRLHGGVILATITAAALALFLDLHVLVDLLSAGTLLAHAAAAAAVLLLRYRPPPPPPPSPPTPAPPPLQLRSGSVVLSEDSDSSGSSEDVVLSSSLGTFGARGSLRGVVRGPLRGQPIAVPGAVRASLPRLRRGPLGRLKPGVAAAAAVVGLISAAALMGVATAAGSAVGAAVPAFAIVVCLALLCAHQQRAPPSSSPAPLEPLLPAIALVLDVTLLLHLRALAWLRLAGWTAAGLLVYFSYGIRHGASDSGGANSDCVANGASSADGRVKNHAAAARTGHRQQRVPAAGAPGGAAPARPPAKHSPGKPATMSSSSSSSASLDNWPFLVGELTGVNCAMDASCGF